MRLCGSILVLALALVAPAALADGAAASTPEVAVDIAAGDARDGEALAQVTRELLGRLAVRVRIAQVARLDLSAIVAPAPGARPAEAPLARVWIDWRSAGPAKLYLLDARRDRVLVRDVERPAGGEELAREELGHILETACEGLLAGGEVGVPRAGIVPLLAPPAPPAATIAAPAPAEAEAAARWQLAVLYEAAALAPEAPVTHGPLASLFVATAARPSGRRVGLWATAQLRLPVRTGDQSVGVSAQAGAFRSLLALETALSPRLAARAGLGGGVDVVRATPEAPMPDRAVLEGARTLTFAIARAQVGLDLRLGRRMALVGTLAADVDLTGQRYAFRRASGEDVVLNPWLVRPAAALGLAFP